MPDFHSYYKPPELHIPVERSRFAMLPNAMAAGVPGSLNKRFIAYSKGHENFLLWPTIAYSCSWPVKAHMHMFILLQSSSSSLHLCCVHPLSIILYTHSGFLYTTWAGSLEKHLCELQHNVLTLGLSPQSPPSTTGISSRNSWGRTWTGCSLAHACAWHRKPPYTGWGLHWGWLSWSSWLKHQTWLHPLPHTGFCGAMRKWLLLCLGGKWGNSFSLALPLSFPPAHTSAGRCAWVGLSQTLPRPHGDLGAQWHHTSSQGWILHPTQPALAAGKTLHCGCFAVRLCFYYLRSNSLLAFLRFPMTC